MIRLASSASVVPAEGLWAGGLLKLSRRHHKLHFDQCILYKNNPVLHDNMGVKRVATDRWLLSAHYWSCSDPAAEVEAEED